jgi:hypothetical protein
VADHERSRGRADAADGPSTTARTASGECANICDEGGADVVQADGRSAEGAADNGAPDETRAAEPHCSDGAYEGDSIAAHAVEGRPKASDEGTAAEAHAAGHSAGAPDEGASKEADFERGRANCMDETDSKRRWPQRRRSRRRWRSR